MEDYTDMAPGADDVGFLLKSITDKIHMCADAQFMEFGLTGSQVRYIAFLSSRGGSATQKQLEDYFGVSHPTVIGIVRRLSDKGYVTVRMDERDRRGRIVSMTEHARSVEKNLLEGRLKMEKDLTADMPPEDRKELIRLLLVLNSSMSRRVQALTEGRDKT